MKALIRQEIAPIPPEMAKQVMQNFRVRLQTCIDSEGWHMDHVILKINNGM